MAFAAPLNSMQPDTNSLHAHTATFRTPEIQGHRRAKKQRRSHTKKKARQRLAFFLVILNYFFFTKPEITSIATPTAKEM